MLGGVPVPVGLAVADNDVEALVLGVLEDDAPLEIEAVADAVTVLLPLIVEVGVPDAVLEAVGVSVGVGAPVGVTDTVDVAEADAPCERTA